MRASSVVNRHWAGGSLALRRFVQAATSARTVPVSGTRRSRHCRPSAPDIADDAENLKLREPSPCVVVTLLPVLPQVDESRHNPHNLVLQLQVSLGTFLGDTLRSTNWRATCFIALRSKA